MSRWVTSARRRSRALLSPEISTLLVRSSAMSLTGVLPSPAGWPAESWLMTRTVSVAEACSRWMMSMSSPLVWSMRSMIFSMRDTFAAWSVMIRTLADG